MMQFCINEASIMKQGNLISHIESCSAQNIAFMEIRKSCLIQYLRNGGTLEVLRDMLERCNVKPVCLNGVENISFLDKRGMYLLRESCEYLFYCCRAIGCDCVEVIGSFQVPTEAADEIFQETVQALVKLSKIARVYGIRLALEYMGLPDSSVKNFSQALDIIRAVNQDNVGLLLDTWHHYAMGSPVEDISRAKGEEIFIVHISDCPERVPGTAIRTESFLPREGVISIVPMLKELKTIGYHGVVSVETFAPELSWMPISDYLSLAQRKTLSVMTEAEVL